MGIYILKSSNHTKYRADIDGLRAFAVLLVVFYHAFPLKIQGGFIGVDIFFVISGFLISSIIMNSLKNKKFSFIEFYSRRINRIFPSLLFVLISSFIIGWFVLLPDELKQLGKHIVGAATFTSNILLWNESGYFDVSAETKPLLHLWSLGIEEQFYIIWPFLILMAYKLNFNVLIVFISMGFISFIFNVLNVNENPIGAFYSPQTRFWELIFGSILAYIKLNKLSLSAFFHMHIVNYAPSLLRLNSSLILNVTSFVGAGLIVISVINITKESQFPGWWALLPATGTFLIIFAGQNAYLNKYVLSNRFFVWIGLISFPLYLWHWPLLSFYQINYGNSPSFLISISIIFISILLAWFTYEMIEKQIRLNVSINYTSSVCILFLFSIGCIGYNIYDKNGYGSRYSPLIKELVDNNNKDSTKSWRVGSCHLLPQQDYLSFKSCASEKKTKDKQTIMIWGDSHGAHLYSGYLSIYGEKYRLIQRTASTCPPIRNYELKGSPECIGINDKVLEYIRDEKPEKIILAAAWDVYDWRRVEDTVNILREIGIQNIILIGSVPRWKDSLSRQLLIAMKNDDEHRIPNRMKLGLEANVFDLDIEMTNFASELMIEYISPTQILCNQNGCLTRLGETRDSLTSFDSSHLTEIGAKYVVSNFKNEINKPF